jgi:hypothetical protein
MQKQVNVIFISGNKKSKQLQVQIQICTLIF